MIDVFNSVYESRENKKTKLIKILGSVRWIASLQMSGPIVSPLEVPVNICKQLVCAGHEVYEVNPNNRNEQVLLTVSNFDDINKFKSSSILPNTYKTNKQQQNYKKTKQNKQTPKEVDIDMDIEGVPIKETIIETPKE